MPKPTRNCFSSETRCANNLCIRKFYRKKSFYDFFISFIYYILTFVFFENCYILLIFQNDYFFFLSTKHLNFLGII